MLYLAIPAHNEVATIGVLLWRLRTVLAEFPREYEVVVYDDASTDDTAAVAEQYERAMPVSVLRGASRLGYAGALDALLRHISTRTRYPRRDAVLLMQGDFTDPPGIVPEFARRFEGGADLVVGERLTVADAPTAVKRLFKYGHWAMRPFVQVQGVADLTASMRLVRISALREAIRMAGNAPLVHGDSWTANADLLLRLAPHARRVEPVPMEPTFGVRMRETRRTAMTDTISVLKWAWGARGRKAVVGSSPAETGPDERRGPRQPGRRRDEPELSVERLREKVRERDGSSGLDGEPQPDGRRGRRRERVEGAERPERPERGQRGARPERQERGERTERPERGERPARAERTERTEAAPKGERAERRSREKPVADAAVTAEGAEHPPRGKTRTARGGEPRSAEARHERSARRREETPSPFADPAIELDDPFAAPSSRREARAFDEIVRAATDAEPAAEERYEPEPISGTEPAARMASAEADSFAAGHTERAVNVPAEADTAEADETDSDDADGESDGESSGDGEPRRKRRRNRRSRRGRRKKPGQDGAEGEGEAGDGDGDDRPAAVAGEGRDDAPVRFTPGDHVDGQPVQPRWAAADGEGDDEAGDDDADGDDLAGGVESMADGTARPRRRGRRGRRGGARRSRGRKDRGDGAAPESTPDGE